jgi:hypothetical protein
MTELVCGCLRRLIWDLFLLAFIDELPAYVTPPPHGRPLMVLRQDGRTGRRSRGRCRPTSDWPR